MMHFQVIVQEERNQEKKDGESKSLTSKKYSTNFCDHLEALKIYSLHKEGENMHLSRMQKEDLLSISA